MQYNINEEFDAFLRSQQAQFYIEAGLLSYYYYEPNDASKYLRCAKDTLGCVVDLTGKVLFVQNCTVQI